MNDKSYRLLTISQLSDDCLTTAWWLSDNCLMTHWTLPDDCLKTSWWLPDNCLMTAWWLPDKCLTTAWCLLDYRCVTTTVWQPPCDNHWVITAVWQPTCNNHRATTTMRQPLSERPPLVMTPVWEILCNDHSAMTTVYNASPKQWGLFGQLRRRGGIKVSHFRIMVSGGLNFHSSYTNSTSYESWHIQLNFETLVRSLRLIVWPQEVTEVTEVKMKKK